MTDEDVRAYLSEYKKTHTKMFKRYLNKDYVVYIENRFNDTDSFTEKLYRIMNDLNESPLCPICGKHVHFTGKLSRGYNHYCSLKCSANSDAVKEKYKETNLKKYGCENVSQSKEIQEKVKQTNLERYGVEYSMQNDEVKKKAIKTNLKKYGCECSLQNKEINEKAKQTNLKKYGCENPSQSTEVKEKRKQTNFERYGNIVASKSAVVKEKAKQTNLNRYGVVSTAQIKEVQEKINATKRKNHTFNTSQPEEDVYLMLCEKFGSDDVKRQYKSEVYPFNCDFYIVNKDLYIELNFHWTHGGHPFDSLNESDQKQLSEWKDKQTEYYESAVKMWTVKDPLKIKTAKENHLNYKLFYNMDEFNEWFNGLQ